MVEQNDGKKWVPDKIDETLYYWCMWLRSNSLDAFLQETLIPSPVSAKA